MENRMMNTILYKYRSFTEHTLPMLYRGTVWMSLPSSFNDPFDCKPTILGDIETKTQIAKHIRITSLMATLRQGLERGNIQRKSAKKLLSELHKAKTIDQAYPLFEKWYSALPIKWPLLEPRDVYDRIGAKLNEIGVLSLSERPDSMLMWAHYANNHQGFCLGFAKEPGSMLGEGNYCKAVRYVRDFPQIDMDAVKIVRSIALSKVGINKAAIEMELTDVNLQNVIYCKSLDWEYEHEWRLIMPKGGLEYPYPGPLCEVIFGLRCNATIRESITAALKYHKKSTSVKFREAFTESDSFVIGLRDVID